MNERLKRLIAKREEAAKNREQVVAQRSAITELAEQEVREELSDEEDAEFRVLTEKVKNTDEELRGLDERITELSEELQRDAQVTAGAAAVKRAQAHAQVTNEGRTYAQGNGQSYIRDLMRVQRGMDDGASATRLQRHAQDVATAPEYRDLSRTEGQGGYFVPPAWLMSQFIDLARPGRAYANAVTTQALPTGTDSISIPRVKTGTSTAVQTADNAAVAESDLTDDSITAKVRTIAGQQDLAIQLLDQSPVNFDEVVFRDLVADYATKVDLQVINGTGAAGQVLGVRNTPNIQTIALTATTTKALWAKISDAIQRVQTSRFAQPDLIVLHPRRWAALQAATDTDGRPLLGAFNPVNGLGSLNPLASEQVVGTLQGLPVITDPNMPTTVGTSPDNTQDVVHIVKASDFLLYESGLRTRVLPEIGSGNLTVRLQVYGYVAFTAERYPASIVEISGAGLAAPTFD